MLISRPMLAAHISTVEELRKLTYPMWGYAKVDGVRVIKNYGLYTKQFKTVRNKWLRNELLSKLPQGVDGELVCGNSFGETTSALSSNDKAVSWNYYIFDYIETHPEALFATRQCALYSVCDGQLSENVHILPKVVCASPDDVVDFAKSQVQYPFNEGVVLRNPHGIYKQGRCTLKEQYLVAYKEWETAVGEVVAVEDRNTHVGVATTNELGLSTRDSRQENLESLEEIGAVVVAYYDEITRKKNQVCIGTGFKMSERRELYHSIVGKKVRFKYRPSVKDNVRHPILLEVL